MIKKFEYFNIKKFNESNYRKKEENALKCIRNLYKSTYGKNALSKNNFYKIDSTDEKFVYIIDNENGQIAFTKEYELPYYFIGDYFDIKNLDLIISAKKYNL